jgi:hypothetical protein
MPHHWILLLDPFRNLLNAYRMILEEEKFLVETYPDQFAIPKSLKTVLEEVDKEYLHH